MPNILNRIRTWRRRIQAQSDYFDHDKAAGRYLTELGTAYSPECRANLLLLAAKEGSHCARLRDQGFEPCDAEPGHTMAESLTWSALLELALYTVERSIAEQERRLHLAGATALLPAHMHTAEVDAMADRIEQAGAAILDRMVQAPLVSDRVRMARIDLHEALYPIVGVHAGEALATLKAPVPHASGYELAN